MPPNAKTPVLFLGFNRPDLAEQVFAAIRDYQPKQLFIAVDGPRVDVPEDAEAVQQMRQFDSRVDWDCEVETLYHEQNEGCQAAVSGAIDWFFSHVEEGIILEDDCVPDLSFFAFCHEMLDRFRDDTRVMSISGECYPGAWQDRCDASYSFSCYSLIWGWATWRRAWQLYDGSLTTFPDDVKSGWLDRFFRRQFVRDEWLEHLWYTHNTPGFTWDYQWVYATWIHSGLCIVPTQNLISNIGCGPEATHTVTADWKMANRVASSLSLPLKHPTAVKRNYLLDETLEETRYEMAEPEDNAEEAWSAPVIREPPPKAEEPVKKRIFSRKRFRKFLHRTLRPRSEGRNGGGDTERERGGE
ncbi:glycosyltransferase family 2 protein [Novipirellula sp.]|uniref:glycosyltransferase family 2 protein n=1 Tax=Novipirellula sp. TaxID=2795430 RepID=UPI003567E8CE